MYGSQQAQQFKDLNLPYRRKDSDPHDTILYNQQQQPQHQQMSSGLLRYRSAPSTLLGEFCEDFVPVRPLSSPERIFDRFLASDLEKPSVVTVSNSNQHLVTGSGVLSAGENIMYQNSNQLLENSFRAVGSMGMDGDENKNGGNSNGHSSLIRQSSSPAGLFAQLNPENGFGMMRGINGFRTASGPSGDSANRLKNQLSFSLSRQNSIMSQISEVGSEGMDGSSPEDSPANRSFISGFPIGSWDEHSLLSENSFSGIKRGPNGEVKIIPGPNSSEHQNGLTHQFSLPKTSSEMTAIEKFLQDSVPCKIRAKRGCATHPRSIAERVRRTRISERMRKLQELVPNMDKQTNTADMLDLAVDYIKDLQKQVKMLSDSRASCTCSASKQTTFANSAV